MFSRRQTLLALASTPLACRARALPKPRAPQGGASGAVWGGLEVATTGSMSDQERGGAAVVLLHGWGAPADNLLPLARALTRPRARFFVPAGPLAEGDGGRAWWHLEPNRFPRHAWTDKPAADFQPHPQVLASRVAVQAVLKTIVERYRPDALMLAGFSQGAMLSLDVALAAAPAVTRVASLSGALLMDSLAALKSPRPARPQMFLSHGRQDQRLPFEGSEHARDLLQKYGFHVTWRPFDGGHQIPAGVVEALRPFLFGPS